MAINTVTFDDLRVRGDLTVGGMGAPSDSTVNDTHFKSDADIKRVRLATDSNKRFVLPLVDCRVHDNIATLLPGTSAADDLGLVGVSGTSSMHLTTGDVKASTITRYARILFYVPPCYLPGATTANAVVVYAGMVTTVADDTATVDIELRKCDRFNAVDADIINTGAQSINSLTFGEDSFSMNESLGTPIEPGDMFDMRITVNVVDAATGTAVEARIGQIAFECDVKG